jgi:hypothetical protein
MGRQRNAEPSGGGNVAPWIDAIFSASAAVEGGQGGGQNGGVTLGDVDDSLGQSDSEGRPTHVPDAESAAESTTPRGPDPSEPPPARSTSAAQIAANRRNAQRSTGPRSAAGKAQSSLNAMRHGAYGRPQAIPRGILAESKEDVEAYVEAIVAALDPRDAPELVIARRIATSDLRLARLERYEGVAMAKVGRVRSERGEELCGQLVYEHEVDMAHLAALSLDPDRQVDIWVDDWHDIAALIYSMHRAPREQRLVPKVDDDDPAAGDIWRQYVHNTLIPKYWDSAETAIADLNAEAVRLAKYRTFDGWLGEERAVTEALAKGGPIDAASTLRARVQRESDRDRATYAKLQQRVLDDDGEDGPQVDAEC